MGYLTVLQKLGGPTQRVLLRFHKFRTTTDIANDKLTITMFARKNFPAHTAVNWGQTYVLIWNIFLLVCCLYWLRKTSKGVLISRRKLTGTHRELCNRGRSSLWCYTRLSRPCTLTVALSPWLGPCLAAWRRVMYFRFCGWRHVFAQWTHDAS